MRRRGLSGGGAPQRTQVPKDAAAEMKHSMQVARMERSAARTEQRMQAARRSWAMNGLRNYPLVEPSVPRWLHWTISLTSRTFEHQVRGNRVQPEAGGVLILQDSGDMQFRFMLYVANWNRVCWILMLQKGKCHFATTAVSKLSFWSGLSSHGGCWVL